MSDSIRGGPFVRYYRPLLRYLVWDAAIKVWEHARGRHNSLRGYLQGEEKGGK